MSLPKFQAKSKPQITLEEFDSNKKEYGKFIEQPGTYDLMIKQITFKDEADRNDSAWIGASILLEHMGKTVNYFLSIPTECRNGFLYGEKRQTFPLEKLQRFLRGLGFPTVYEDTMETVALVFGQPDKIIGKTISAKLAYRGPHVKYLEKDAYQVVDSDHVTAMIDGVYPTVDSAKAAAAEQGLKIGNYSGFLDVAEIFPKAHGEGVSLEVPADTSLDAELPF